MTYILSHSAPIPVGEAALAAINSTNPLYNKGYNTDNGVMISLNWPQVCAWCLSQHSLHQRANENELIAAVSCLAGVQAQLKSAAKLAIWARGEGNTSAGIQAALWDDRSLIKTWVMRWTLHLIPSRKFPLFVAARKAFTIYRPPSYYSYHSVTPLTREELAGAIVEQSGKPNLRAVLLSRWWCLQSGQAKKVFKIFLVLKLS